MYVSPNFPSKKKLKEAVAAGKEVTIFQPGLGTAPSNGKGIAVEGPHHPKLHTWYAQVDVLNGVVVRVK
jgi:hypothetical protein